VITRGEATRLINKEDAVVVDLRQRDDFRRSHRRCYQPAASEIKANNTVSWRSIKPSRLSLLMDRHAGAGICATHCIKQALKRIGTERRASPAGAGKSPLVRGK
jgi:hypothetical protein